MSSHNAGKQGKNIVIIGGGLAGLSAAYDLSQSRHQVVVIEASERFGGLAESFHLNGKPVEMFYHFVCRADRHLIDLANELGIDHRLHWQTAHTAFYHNGRTYPFGTPWDLLMFTPVPFFQRLRFGMHIIQSRYRKKWRELDKVTAVPWLINKIGQQAYYVIWHPLIKVKFGGQYDQISAAWIWHRIWRVASSRKRLWERETFGYFEDGSIDIVNTLVDYLSSQENVKIIKDTKVERIHYANGKIQSVKVGKENIAADYVVSTVALPILNQLLNNPQGSYFSKMRQIEYIGVVCALFNLNRPFTKYFWLNTNDPRISFNGIIEQTNLNRIRQKDNLNLVYVPFYISTNSERYSFDDDALFKEYTSMLALINPQFNNRWIEDYYVFRAPYAQAICSKGFADLVPAHRSPIRGLFVTDSAQFYPEDRTLSAAIKQGRTVAQMILEEAG